MPRHTLYQHLQPKRSVAALLFVLPFVMYGIDATPVHAQPTVGSADLTLSAASVTTNNSLTASVRVINGNSQLVSGAKVTFFVEVPNEATIAFQSAELTTIANGTAQATLGPITQQGTYSVIASVSGATFTNPFKSNSLPLTITTASTPTPTKPGGGTIPAGNEVSIPNPITCGDATCLVGQVIKYILGVIAIIATLMFIWGGVMMLTSGGNAEQVKKARETLVWATIGIIVILLSWAIIRFVLTGLVGVSKK